MHQPNRHLGEYTSSAVARLLSGKSSTLVVKRNSKRCKALFFFFFFFNVFFIDSFTTYSYIDIQNWDKKKLEKRNKIKG